MVRSVVAMNNTTHSSRKTTVSQRVWRRFRSWVRNLAEDLTEVQAPCVPEIRNYPQARKY